jgi:hypothetical protein
MLGGGGEMAKKKDEYVIVDALSESSVTQRLLNEWAASGYEVVTQSYSGTDDTDKAYCCWTLRRNRAAETKQQEMAILSKLMELISELQDKVMVLEGKVEKMGGGNANNK